MLRLENRLTQEKLSGELSCSVPAYSKIETGATDITDTRLQRLAKFYNMRVADIYNYGEPVDNVLLLELAKIKEELSEKDARILYLQTKLIELYEAQHAGK